VKIETNVREFNASLTRFLKSVGDKAVVAHRKVALDVLRGLILASPVDTGRLRGGWNASVATPSDWAPPTGVVDKAEGTGTLGAERLAEAAVAISASTLGSVLWISNSVSYVGVVNDRHKNKAGFVEATLQNVGAALDTRPTES
jgi:hypothetical protein